MSACSASSCVVADSALAIISVTGMYAGVTAKFSPFFSRAIFIFLLMSVFGGVKDSLGFGLDLFYYPVGVICRERERMLYSVLWILLPSLHLPWPSVSV